MVDALGHPVAGAEVDVWHASPVGLYENQDPDQADMNLRGKFTTDADGRFWFRSVMMVGYPIPTDGVVGRLLKVQGRHPYRPGHIHMIVSADGYRPVTTHLFVAGSQYLDSDAVFGMKESLVAQFDRHEPGTAPGGERMDVPFYTVNYDFRLRPATLR